MRIAHYDASLSSKLRHIQRQLEEWADKADTGRLSPRDAERMRFEAKALTDLMSNKEL